jgi:hypothetical protein
LSTETRIIIKQRLSPCETLNHHLSAIARQHPHTKFLRALASDLDFAVNTADAVLPTLLVYQAGELKEKLIAVDRHWGRKPDVTQADVKGVLSRFVYAPSFSIFIIIPIFL